MLDEALKDQVKSIFSNLSSSFTLDIYVSDNHESKAELIGLLEDLASCSDKIECKINQGNDLKFEIVKENKKTGIIFRAVPNGHEFSTLLLAILNCDGKGKNFPDEFIQNRVKSLKGKIHIKTYISLTCTNCPDVVQAINLMTIINPNISHEIVDGAINQEEVDKLKIQGVPAVFADGEFIHSGRADFGELLDKMEGKYGTEKNENTATERKEFDVLVIGAGPAGSSSAIYLARKGLKIAVIANNVGGQVKETVGIENVISIPHTTGSKLAEDLRKHLQEYPIEVFENRTVESLKLEGKNKVITAKGGEIFSAPALIIATGASWRKLNVEGESKYIGKGVAFCPHCDGPFYKNKHVAVIGGGNSGIEAAIDLAGICSKITVLEFLDELKADQVLQEKLQSLPNVEVYLSSQTLEVIGDNNRVVGIKVKDRKTGEERLIDLNGIFVQIGLMPNSSAFREIVRINSKGEIEIDNHCRTNIPGIYAAGDVSSVPYKQIIVSMGEGAKAALSAFDDRIRGTY
ncbi:MAG: alkyl hydroperoxide reductase subunit F [Dysgonamonadaceae bacterium]|jgi:alkyl hydroperoxide reductase subunit F|nr:alkyl hydroperoxide reductase subunit F [Dysgonamonadaceae bacterium]